MSEHATPAGEQAGASGPRREPRAPWFLHPRPIVLLLGVSFLIVAYLVPEGDFLTLYRSAKRIDLDFVLVSLIIYAGFLAGTFFAVGTGTGTQEREVISYCRWFVWPAFGLTVFGYVVWFGSNAVRAGGPGPILDAVYQVAVNPTPGLSDYVKFELFQTIPGVTTLTQIGVLYATLEAILWVRGESPGWLSFLRFAAVVSLTLPRAVLLSERLALVEFVVPAAVVVLAGLYTRGTYRGLVRLAPIFLGAAVFGLFALGEYFRSWNFYKAVYPGPYLEFAAQRFAGYYTTAVNNAAVVSLYEPLHPLRHTLNSLFEFPVLGESVHQAYEAVFGSGYSLGGGYGEEENLFLLEVYANPEFNNVPLIGLLPNEYTVFLAPVAAFFLGLVSISLYRSFVKGRLLGVLVYPSWFVGVLEISRIYYWTGGRYFPVLAFLAFSLLLFGMARVPARGRAAKGEGATLGT